MWPVDKLSLLQDALGLTGNNIPSVADDGSEEWDKASIAYEAALPYAIEGRDWKFGTTVATLTASPTAPTDPAFDTAFAKPPDLLHLIWVKLADVPVDYQILANQIVLNRSGTSAVTAKYVRAPTIDQVTPTFAMALRCFVMSGIYRGLNEDIPSAREMWQMGEAMLAHAATRADQEQGRRSPFISRMATSRRSPRPLGARG